MAKKTTALGGMGTDAYGRPTAGSNKAVCDDQVRNVFGPKNVPNMAPPGHPDSKRSGGSGSGSY